MILGRYDAQPRETPAPRPGAAIAEALSRDELFPVAVVERSPRPLRKESQWTSSPTPRQ